MPIHFSIGFVAEDRPKRQVESVCAKAYNIKEVECCVREVQEVVAMWIYNVSDCK